MLTKNQAASIADALATGARSNRELEADISAPRVPWYFRSNALLRLPLRQQAQLLAQARRSALLTLQSGVLALSWAAFVVLLSVMLWPLRGGVAFWLLLAATLAMGTQVRIMLVRLRINELLLEEVRVASRPAHTSPE